MEQIIALLGHWADVIKALPVGTIATVLAFILEAVMRVAKTSKPMSIIYGIKKAVQLAAAAIAKAAQLIGKAGELIGSLAEFLDKVLPQNISQ